MFNPNEFAANLKFDEGRAADVWKSFAAYGQRIATLNLDTAAAITDVATKGSLDSIANLRDLTTVREDPSAYAEAFSTFAKKQSELASRNAEQLGDIARDAQNSTSELVSDAGEEAVNAADVKDSKGKGGSKAA